MTTDQLQYFLTLAAHLNYSAAAEQLFISQSTLSRSISAFEEEIGAKLLTRSSNRVSLTPAGKLMKERAPQLLEQMNSLRIACRSLGDGIRGSLFIGVPDDQQINPWVLRAAEQFRSSNPDSNLVFRAGPIERQRRDIAEGRCNLLLSVRYQASDFAGMKTAVYAEDEAVLAVPVHFPHPVPDTLDFTALPACLSGARCFVTQQSESFWRNALGPPPQGGPGLRLWPMVGGEQSMVLSVTSGEGAALTNRWSVFSGYQTVRCVRLTGAPPLRLAAAWLPAAADNPLAASFLQLLCGGPAHEAGGRRRKQN